MEIDEKTIQKIKREYIKNTQKLVCGLADAGKWDEFTKRVHMAYEVMPYAFAEHYPHMPEEYRRDFVVGCYEHHGDCFPCCRKALRELPKSGINELPPEYASQDIIIVYRAGEESIEKAPYRISWTLDIETAELFLATNGFARYLYRAVIRPCDVIAYNNNRDEQEVMQYRSVRSIELLKKLD